MPSNAWQRSQKLVLSAELVFPGISYSTVTPLVTISRVLAPLYHLRVQYVVERRQDHHLREVLVHAVHAQVVIGEDAAVLPVAPLPSLPPSPPPPPPQPDRASKAHTSEDE